MTLRLNSTGGGFIEIDAPNTASNFSVTMPAAAGDVVVADASGDIQTTRTGTGGTSASALVVGYQQGTWTPLVVLGTATGDNASWSRIGNLVIVRGRFITFSDTTTATTIECSAASFPYDPIVPPNTVCIGSCFASNIGRQPTLVSHVTTGGARFCSSAANNSSNILTARHSDIGTNPSLNFTFSYLTEDTTWTPNAGTTVS